MPTKVRTWRTLVQMKNTRLIATLGREPHTPLDLAVEATLVGMGSIAVNQRDGAERLSDSIA